MVGFTTTLRTVLKGYSIGKVEKHWSRGTDSVLFESIHKSSLEWLVQQEVGSLKDLPKCWIEWETAKQK